MYNQNFFGNKIDKNWKRILTINCPFSSVVNSVLKKFFPRYIVCVCYSFECQSMSHKNYQETNLIVCYSSQGQETFKLLQNKVYEADWVATCFWRARAECWSSDHSACKLMLTENLMIIWDLRSEKLRSCLLIIRIQPILLANHVLWT